MHRLFNSKNKILNELITKTHEAEMLTQLLTRFLDAELATQCKVIHFQKGCLTIAISSAAWSTKFRFYQASLLSQLRTAGKLYNLRTIKMVIDQPSMPQLKISPAKRAGLSKTSADIIRHAAKSISSECLRTALEKLALTRRE